jgi:CIC family chloride channel protein
LAGSLVTGLRYLTNDIMRPRLLAANSGRLMFAVPAAGIALSGLLLRYFADRPDIHDAEIYLEAHHHGRSEARVGSFLAKVAASIATIGLGGAAGFEGPSLYVGSSVGVLASKRLRRFRLDQRGLRALLIAGAGAGISAVFKAP